MTIARYWWWGLLALVAVASGRVVLERLIFFPDPVMPPAPPGVVDRFITTADGVRIHAWWAPPPSRGPTLLWSHGNAGNVGNRAAILMALVARRLGVLAYDYRGYGRSEGTPDETGVYRDSEAAYDEVRALGVPAERIVCFGESLGGAVSIRLATVRPVAGVAVVATFPSLRDVARVHYGVAGAAIGGRFDMRQRLARLAVPLLVAHGDEDEIVPYELGQRLYEAAPGPKRFVRVPGATHNDVLGFPGLLDAVAAFADEVAAQSR
ncbi:MAG TPA: alpha/beta hydrolase [Candidatus Limnocylindria bacterium]|nr:alpha/beta hydrolase [Candidatus Limnocylindria bacterium]